MTPIEKAKELFNKYKGLSNECDCLEYSCICFHMGDYKAKDCAFIAVDEIVEALTISTGHLVLNSVDDCELTKDFKYWETVKIEINKL